MHTPQQWAHLRGAALYNVIRNHDFHALRAFFPRIVAGVVPPADKFVVSPIIDQELLRAACRNYVYNIECIRGMVKLIKYGVLELTDTFVWTLATGTARTFNPPSLKELARVPEFAVALRHLCPGENIPDPCAEYDDDDNTEDEEEGGEEEEEDEDDEDEEEDDEEEEATGASATVQKEDDEEEDDEDEDDDSDVEFVPCSPSKRHRSN